MKTPEKIATAAVEDAIRKNGHEDWTTEQVEAVTVAAAREAQREVDRTSEFDQHETYMEGWHAGFDEALSVEPQFAPEGEPDVYRNAFERVHSTLQSRNFDAVTVYVGNFAAGVDEEQARHILAYLSEQDRM